MAAFSRRCGTARCCGSLGRSDTRCRQGKCYGNGYDGRRRWSWTYASPPGPEKPRCEPCAAGSAEQTFGRANLRSSGKLPPEKDEGGPRNAPSDNLGKPGGATLAEDRGKYILDGNGRGGGGHGPGRATPGKSTFPSDWSDEKTIEAIKDVANDPASVREPAKGERTAVKGTRDEVEIEVIIGRDRKAIVTAYPVGAGSEKK